MDFEQNNDHSAIEMLLSLYIKGDVGPASYFRLLKYFGSADSVYQASGTELKAVCPHLTQKALKNIMAGPDMQAVDSQLTRCKEMGIRLVSIFSSEYPRALASISSPPPFLYIKGRWPLPAHSRAIGVVGTRKPTDYGKNSGKEIVSGLVKEGYVIVSGLAKGIDTVAHQTTLDVGGHTVAVLGCGLDRVYPACNKKLFTEIADTGTLVSEFSLGEAPALKNFPLRNRIISGMSLGTLVVEAGLKSGALITAQYARRQERALFAVPGSVFNRSADGNNRLLQNGARLVMHPQDISHYLKSNKGIAILSGSTFKANGKKHNLEVMGQKTIENKPVKKTNKHKNVIKLLPETEKKIYQQLGEALSLEKLSQISGSAPHVLISILLNLEMKGLITRQPGSLYCQKM
ncbi:MAG: DNA-protecting protein DprA [Fibrobacteria bacterium]|nr:DNA-protecting protein DprA [Fibrobacteria bacterium]